MTEPDLSQPWEEVEVTIHYSDRGKMASLSTTVSRAEMEEREKRVMLENAETLEKEIKEPEDENDPAREAAEGWRARAERFTISDEDFKGYIIQQATKAASSPLRVAGRLPGSVRILPPWAVKEVTIEPKGLSNIITLPS